MGGSVTATGKGKYSSVGASLETGNSGDAPSCSTLIVGDDVQASGRLSSLALQITTNGNGIANATVDGDLVASSDEDGSAQALYVFQHHKEGAVNVTVGGTIKVEGKVGKGVIVVGTPDAGNTNINAWKIEAPEEGKSVVFIQKGNELENPEQYINYIVKARADLLKAGSKLNDYGTLGISLLNKDLGEALLNKNDKYSTIKGGGTLQFRVEAPAGKKVKAVYGYYEDDKSVVVAEAADVLLTKNADGTYSLKVRQGGGIMLFVEYEDVEEEKKPEEQKEEQKDEKQEEQKPDEKKEEGQKQEESKEAESASDNAHLASTGQGTSESSASNTLPATGDAASMLPVAMMAVAGMGAVAAGRRSRRE